MEIPDRGAQKSSVFDPSAGCRIAVFWRLIPQLQPGIRNAIFIDVKSFMEIVRWLMPSVSFLLFVALEGVILYQLYKLFV